MLVDEVTITVKAGDGGDGLVAFRREKFVPRGGPWGGNGGDGGDVYLETVDDIAALRRYRNQKFLRAQDGRPGGIGKKHGRNGSDLVLPIPVGTVVTDQTSGKVHDFDRPGERILIARGGRGGRGNWVFATATRQTPRFAEKGENGEDKELTFELKLIADFGFIGLPNVGKSSLLNELTNAHARVAVYPFTTLEPNLGALDGLILADIPGLIEGASKGRGLGSKFLRHIARTRILGHCLSVESADLIKDYETIRGELKQFSQELVDKKEILLLTKTDLFSLTEMKSKMRQLRTLKREVLAVSIHDWQKIQALRRFLLKKLEKRTC